MDLSSVWALHHSHVVREKCEWQNCSNAFRKAKLHVSNYFFTFPLCEQCAVFSTQECCSYCSASSQDPSIATVLTESVAYQHASVFPVLHLCFCHSRGACILHLKSLTLCILSKALASSVCSDILLLFARSLNFSIAPTLCPAAFLSACSTTFFNHSFQLENMSILRKRPTLANPVLAILI